MRKWIHMAAGAALLLCAAPTFAEDAAAPIAAPKLPTRLAVIPFRCGGDCEGLQKLQQGLVDRLVDDSTFEVILDEQTEALFLEPPQYRKAYDALIGRTSGGLTPDSVTAALLMRRFHVDGFLYGYMGPNGTVIEVWTGKSPAGVAFHYASQTEATGSGALPEADRGSAATRGSVPMTGGANTSGGTGGSPSKGSGKSSGPSSELKTGAERGGQVQLSGRLDDRTREMISSISDRLKKQRRVELKPSNG